MSPEDDDFGERVRTLLGAHRSIRAYDDQPLDENRLTACVEAGRMAATSSNVQAYSALRVRHPATRLRLAELTGGQAQVAAAPAFFVISGDLRRHMRVAERLESKHVDNLETFLVAAIDAALFAQNLVVACEAEGWGTCYIGGLRTQLAEVDALLELPTGVLPFFGLCVGRPAEAPSVSPRPRPRPRPRLPLDLVLADERYPDDARLDAGLDEYDARMAEYYEARGKPGWNWSGTIARKFGHGQRAHLADYYRGKGAQFS